MKIQNVLHVFAQEKKHLFCLHSGIKATQVFISPKQKESLKPSSFTCKMLKRCGEHGFIESEARTE